MSKSSRKERRQSLAARRADPASPAQSMPIPVPVPPTASVSMSASASPENSESAYSPAALEALLYQLSAAGGGDTPDSPEFTEFLNSLRPSKSATPVIPVAPASVETTQPQPPADLPRSGGPTTEAGKRRSSQNSFKHGLAASFFHFKFIAGENPAEYAELLSEVRAQFLPRTRAESHKIEDMAQAWWLQRRARNMQTSALESADDKAFALYLRYETTQRRSYQAAYQDFKDMQKHRLAIAASTDPARMSQQARSKARLNMRPRSPLLQSPRRHQLKPKLQPNTLSPPDNEVTTCSEVITCCEVITCSEVMTSSLVSFFDIPPPASFRFCDRTLIMSTLLSTKCHKLAKAALNCQRSLISRPTKPQKPPAPPFNSSFRKPNSSFRKRLLGFVPCTKSHRTAKRKTTHSHRKRGLAVRHPQHCYPRFEILGERPVEVLRMKAHDRHAVRSSMLTLTLVTGASLLLGCFAVSARADIPDGPGKAATLRVCSKCHSPEQAVSLRQDRDEWEDTISKMVKLGATGSDDDFDAVLNYLAKYFGPEATKPVNVNQATAVDLESGLQLPRSEAEAIVQYRTAKGNFHSIDDLRNVPGLDFKKIEAKKSRLTF